MSLPLSDVVLTAELSQADYDKICDAIEAEIVRLQNINYASKEAQVLMELESQIVLRVYKAGKR